MIPIPLTIPFAIQFQLVQIQLFTLSKLPSSICSLYCSSLTLFLSLSTLSLRRHPVAPQGDCLINLSAMSFRSQHNCKWCATKLKPPLLGGNCQAATWRQCGVTSFHLSLPLASPALLSFSRGNLPQCDYTRSNSCWCRCQFKAIKTRIKGLPGRAAQQRAGGTEATASNT